MWRLDSDVKQRSHVALHMKSIANSLTPLQTGSYNSAQILTYPHQSSLVYWEAGDETSVDSGRQCEPLEP